MGHLTADESIDNVKHQSKLLIAPMLFACIFLSACAGQQKETTPSTLSNAENLPETDINLHIPSLSNCTDQNDKELHLDSSQPVTVFVHGCFASEGQFRSLADVFAFHGQQTVCFNYNDRDSLEVSSAQLITAVEELSQSLQPAVIDVIGHSQGGLVSRRAFVQERPDSFSSWEGVDISLTTISAPFGGIESAAHCGSKKLVWLSLGLIKPLCQMITGSKYNEIPPNSEFMLNPGQLLPVVGSHLNITTDETDSCRRYDEHENCVEDDYVFSIREQNQPAINDDPGLSTVMVKSGHVAIVGDANTAPTKLIEVLQLQGVLNPTPEESEGDLARLLTRLYVAPTIFE